MENIVGQLPNEIIWKILLNMPYTDIINYYESVYNDVDDIYSNDGFWISKTNKDFTFTRSKDGVLLIPSDYIHMTRNYDESGRDIYLRWYEGIHTKLEPIQYPNIQNVLMVELNQNTDIVLFMLDAMTYTISTLFEIQLYAAANSNLVILNKLSTMGLEPELNQVRIIRVALYTGRIPVLDWLEQTLSTMNIDPLAINIVARSGRLKVLEWLRQRGYDISSAEPPKYNFMNNQKPT